MTAARPDRRPPGRMALWLVLAALVLVFAAAGYVLVHRYQTGTIVLEQPPEGAGPRGAYNPMQQLRLLMALLLIATLGIIAFVIGAYLVIRYGRWLTAKKVGGAPTQFVDAWTRYRVTDDDVEKAVRDWETGDDSGEKRPPDDRPGDDRRPDRRSSDDTPGPEKTDNDP